MSDLKGSQSNLTEASYIPGVKNRHQSTVFEMVWEFHNKFGHPMTTYPTLVSREEWGLRSELIREELEEYNEACFDNDIVGIADALGDLLYVVYGACIVHGIPVLPVVSEIHRSNMSKLGLDGKPTYREDGKVQKGPNYSPPNLEWIRKIATQD